VEDTKVSLLSNDLTMVEQDILLKNATIKREVSTIKRASTPRMMTSHQMRVMKTIMMEAKSSSKPKKPRMMITRVLKKKKSFLKKIQMKKPTLIPFGDTNTMQRVNKKMRILKS
jgi:hypothetical protein